MQTIARTLYLLALALLTVMTVGFGTVTFYPGPTMPEYPAPRIAKPAPDGTPTAAEVQAQNEAQAKYDAEFKVYREANRQHARAELAVVTAIGVAILIGGLVASAGSDVLRVGLMLGGIFTVIWGLAKNASEAGSGVMFAVAALGLIALALFSLATPRRVIARAFRLSGTDLLGPRDGTPDGPEGGPR